jgi:hypothetical protein
VQYLAMVILLQVHITHLIMVLCTPLCFLRMPYNNNIYTVQHDVILSLTKDELFLFATSSDVHVLVIKIKVYSYLFQGCGNLFILRVFCADALSHYSTVHIRTGCG